MNFKSKIASMAIALVILYSSCALGPYYVKGRGKIRVLIVGGGTSHDFNKWYKQTDTKTIRDWVNSTVRYTDRIDSLEIYLKQTDVLYLVTNQDIKSESTRKAIFEFVERGNGLVLGHPALWYNWPDWPEYNRQLVGGGARLHDKYGSFEERAVTRKHMVTGAFLKPFPITDERYHYVHDPDGTPIDVLINSAVAGADQIYPSVFMVKHPKARIIAIALGHDAGSHETPQYKRILGYSVAWAAGAGKN